MEGYGGKPLYSRDFEGGTKVGILFPPSLIPSTSSVGIISGGPCQIISPESSFRGNDHKRGSGGSNQSRQSGVLWQVVHTAEAEREVENHYRFVRIEPVHSESHFPNGVSDQYPKLHASGNGCHKHRPLRCILSRPDPPQFSKVYEGSLTGEGHAVQSSTDGSQRFSKGVFQNCDGIVENGESPRYSDPCFPGRLAVESMGQGQRIAKGPNSMGGEASESFGMVSKPRQVGVRSSRPTEICRGEVPSRPGLSTSTVREGRSFGGSNSEDSQSGGSHCQAVDFPDRANGISDETNSSRPASSETHSEIVDEAVGPETATLGSVGASPGRVQSRSKVVVRQEEYSKGGLSSSVETTVDSLHGRFQTRVRGDSRESQSGESLVAGREGTTLKQSGNVGHHQSSGRIPGVLKRKISLDQYRQYHSSGKYKSAGGNTVVGPSRHVMGSVDETGQTQLSGKGSPHTGKVERGSGCLVQNQSKCSNRVGAQSGGSGSTVAKMGNSGSRLVRNQLEPQVAELCIPIPRREGLGSECNVNLVGGPPDVCIPSVVNNGGGTHESHRRSGRGDSSGSGMADSGMVSSSLRSSVRTAPKASSSKGSVVSGTLGEGPQQSGNATSTRLEVVREAVKKKGFSHDVAERISKDVRESSAIIYDSKWDSFTKWCEERGRVPLEADSTVVAEFLLDLFKRRKLAVKTIMGYKAAVAKTLLMAKGTVLNDPYMRALISNFQIERPVNMVDLPKWDLGIVLQALMKAPYEPLSKVKLLSVSKKTVFLLLLASGARCGEIHALDVKRSFISNDKSKMFLKPKKTFLAKNQQVSSGKGKFEGFWINSLSEFVGPDLASSDGLLCPVRACREYIARTAKVRGDFRQLFLAVPRHEKGDYRPACKNTISSWVKHVVKDAYANEPDNVNPKLHRSAHEVRAISSSLCAYKNVAMDKILEQCRWASESTFSSFYLRDISGTAEGLHLLPPFQTAGSVWSTRSQKPKVRP